MTSEELTTLNDVFGALNNDSNENANNYDIIIRNQTSGNAMKVPVATFKTVLYNYLTSASVAASLASVLGVGGKYYHNGSGDYDLNDVHDNMEIVWRYADSSQILHKPTEGTGRVWVKAVYNSTWCIQFYLAQQRELYMRVYQEPTWTEWHKIL